MKMRSLRPYAPVIVYGCVVLVFVLILVGCYFSRAWNLFSAAFLITVITVPCLYEEVRAIRRAKFLRRPPFTTSDFPSQRKRDIR